MIPIQLIVAAMNGNNGIVTLSGEAISSGGAGKDASLIINTDGTLDKSEDDVTTQIDSATDWIIPNSSADALYEMRFVSFVGDAFSTDELGGENNWTAISTNRELALPGDVASKSCSFTLEVRFNGGPTIDTGAFSIATVGP